MHRSAMIFLIGSMLAHMKETLNYFGIGFILRMKTENYFYLTSRTLAASLKTAADFGGTLAKCQHQLLLTVKSK